MGNENQKVAPLNTANDGPSQVASSAFAASPAYRCPTRLLTLVHLLRKTFSFPVFLGALLVAAVFVNSRLRLTDMDTWWHTAVGERILATGTWPTADIYSFTVPGNAWVAYEWLGEVVMALAARLGGLRAMTVLLVGLSGAFILLLYYYAYVRCGNVKAAFVACVVLLPLAVVSFSLRPQLLGFIFLILTLICLERFREGREKAIWILPVVFLLWVNTHGTFTFGLFVLGLYWASGLVDFRWGGLEAKRWTPKQRRQLAVVSLLSVLALTPTPYGTRLAAYPLEMMLSQSANIANIQEWQPMPFNLTSGKLFLGLLILLLLALAFFRPTYRLEEMGLLLFAIYAASVHRRFVLLFVLVFTPLLAALLARWLPRYQAAKDHYALNAALLVLIGAGLVRFLPSQQEIEATITKSYPRGAVEYIRQHPIAGPILNEYTWGGYLIWTLGPEHRVFIDGRADIYEYGGVLADYLRITQLDHQTLPLLRAYGIEACLIERQASLATLLAALPDWEKVYGDDLSVLFVHKNRDSGPRIQALEVQGH